jgi:hypothetical protein
MWKSKQLLELAEVPYKEDQGRQADFHALRRSFNTHLAQAAVDPQTRFAGLIDLSHPWSSGNPLADED